MGQKHQTLPLLSYHEKKCNYVEELTVGNYNIKSNRDMREEGCIFFSKMYCDDFGGIPRLDSL